jgi:hypothetical protein
LNPRTISVTKQQTSLTARLIRELTSFSTTLHTGRAVSFDLSHLIRAGRSKLEGSLNNFAQPFNSGAQVRVLQNYSAPETFFEPRDSIVRPVCDSAQVVAAEASSLVVGDLPPNQVPIQTPAHGRNFEAFEPPAAR